MTHASSAKSLQDAGKRFAVGMSPSFHLVNALGAAMATGDVYVLQEALRDEELTRAALLWSDAAGRTVWHAACVLTAPAMLQALLQYACREERSIRKMCVSVQGVVVHVSANSQSTLDCLRAWECERVSFVCLLCVWSV